MLESVFQSALIKELKQLFPDCVVLKNDPNYRQGIPDLIVLWKNKWAALECKSRKNAHVQPNQNYYIDILDRLSFARFIYPENKEEILHELQQAFQS